LVNGGAEELDGNHAGESGRTSTRAGAGDRRARRRRRFKRLLVGAAIVGLLSIYPLRCALELSADPLHPKDCPPVDPQAGTGPPAPAGAALRLPADPPWAQRGGTINDASCLNRTAVHGIVDVRTVDDIRSALAYARAAGLRVSIAGVRHSMGGQAFARNAVVLDMTRFNRITFDESTSHLTVQSGATWHDIQNVLHPRFAVRAMQSTDIFTVGGSISVNAHGMDHRAGSVGRTIRAMRIMLPDGTIRTASPTENRRLFSLAVGGYGLFGIILDADLEVARNVVYQSQRETLSYRDFVSRLSSRWLSDPAYGLMYGHLSTAPQSLLDEMLVYVYREVDAPDALIQPLGDVSQVKLRRLVFNLSKRGPLAMRLKWFAEKRIEPLIESCTVTRGVALSQGEACFVSRNEPMHDSVPYLRNNLPRETDILHEYFVPQDQFVRFIDGLRNIVRAGGANLLNASVRVVRKEDNVLTYAPQEPMLAVVLYLNQATDRRGNDQMASLTRRLIDLCLESGGRFFLPYQMHYTAAQLERSYPEVREFLASRAEFDPSHLLSSAFADRLESLLGGG
jgi:FAD/FMN-containing dehydrogenase